MFDLRPLHLFSGGVEAWTVFILLLKFSAALFLSFDLYMAINIVMLVF